jgi:hypothetical protein
MIYLAQGSFHPNDKLGGSFHGGYKETVKSKGINPKYVSRFYRNDPQTAQAHVVAVQAATIDGAVVGHGLAYDTSYYLAVDVKGSPMLRFINRNAYIAAQGFTGCAPTGASPGAIADPAPVFEQWAARINEDPILKSFVQATVTYGVIATGAVTYGAFNSGTWAAADNEDKACKITLTSAYVDTTFGTSSFDVTDHYELEPVILSAQVKDEFENLCNVMKFVSTEVTPVRYVQGTGNGLLRDLILFKRYLQEPWQADPRMREVLQETSLDQIIRSTLYTTYHILHSVPRRSNSNSMLDDDQYMLKIVTTGTVAAFETWMNTYMASANNGVQLEVFS